MTDWVQLWFHPEVSLGTEVKDPNPIVQALPLYASIMILELCVSTLMGKKLHNLRQSISNMAAGFQGVTCMAAFASALQLLPFVYVYNNYRLVDWSPERNWWMHALAFFGVDLAFYSFHRTAHESNLGWSAHVVHHSSMDYNFTTSVRMGIAEPMLAWPFYLPLALVCPPKMIGLHRGISTIYQAFTHTELIGKMWSPIEFVFVTPSHHRVHHARNYGRKNHGGLLIIWDRLFGTFQEERADRKPLYGLNNQPVVQGTFNPLWHQVHHLVATFRLALFGEVGMLRAFFTRQTGPGMVHPTMTAALEQPATAAQPAAGKPAQKGRGAPGVEVKAFAGSRPEQPFDPSYPWDRRAFTAVDVYAALQFLLTILVCTGFLRSIPNLDPPEILASGLFGVWSVITSAWLCGGEAKAIKHELFRLAVQSMVGVHVLSLPSMPLIITRLAQAAAGLGCASFAFLLTQLPVKPAGPVSHKLA